jgi:structural maintenance of chromosome 4
MGGNAEIELIDSMDPFSEGQPISFRGSMSRIDSIGVVLSIMPPKKSWRAIANLSGGEKTLASLALVFALHVFKPTPLYFMVSPLMMIELKGRTRSMPRWISRMSLLSLIIFNRRLRLLSCTCHSYHGDRILTVSIVISLRNDMFELAHRLVGIYKTSNVSENKLWRPMLMISVQRAWLLITRI